MHANTSLGLSLRASRLVCAPIIGEARRYIDEHDLELIATRLFFPVYSDTSSESFPSNNFSPEPYAWRENGTNFPLRFHTTLWNFHEIRYTPVISNNSEIHINPFTRADERRKLNCDAWWKFERLKFYIQRNLVISHVHFLRWLLRNFYNYLYLFHGWFTPEKIDFCILGKFNVFVFHNFWASVLVAMVGTNEI